MSLSFTWAALGSGIWVHFLASVYDGNYRPLDFLSYRARLQEKTPAHSFIFSHALLLMADKCTVDFPDK